MNPLLLLFILIAPMSLCAINGAVAGIIGPTDYARVNADLVDIHTVPRYERLAAATRSFASASKAFCVGGKQGNIFTIQSRYHDTMDTWMGIQHVHFGPVEYFMRGYRFYFWPQARGKVSEAVAEVVDDRDNDCSRLPQASVAVQGLMAAEILLFEEEYLNTGGRGCGLLEAIAENMKTMAADILAEWSDVGSTYARLFLTPGPNNPFLEDHITGTFSYFQGILDTLELIHDVNLRPVIGESVSSVRPTLAETRRSSRSQRNIVIMLEALQSLYGGGVGRGLGNLVSVVDPELDHLLRKAFRLTIAAAEAISLPIEKAAADPSLRPDVETLVLRVRALNQILRERLAPALGFGFGFNSLDGD